MMKAVTVKDYRELARRRVPRFLFDYLDGAAFDETTHRANHEDLSATALRQRVLKDVSTIETGIELFGEQWSIPVALAPVGIAGLFARRGETQAVRAAEAAGVPFALSTVSACTIEEVAAAASRPFWFQLYMVRDRAFMKDMLARARAAGCSVLVFTVDLPVPGCRHRDYRSGLAGMSRFSGAMSRFGQALLRPRWAWDVGLRGRPHGLGNVAPLLGRNSGLEDFLAWIMTNFDASITWSDLAFLRDHWDGPIVLKGILDPEDALEAARLEVDGLIVSNHGGRQLDGVLSTVRALPAIADAVGDRMTLLADGGVSSGPDVLRMIALGARAVLVGRAWLYALAGRGQAGVEHMLSLIEKELRVTMALTGCTTIDEIGDHVLDRR